MDLSGIFTIGGKAGLHKLVAQSKNGVIVESLNDGKRFNAYSTYKISSLGDISVFTIEEDVPLSDVFKAIAESNEYKEVEISNDKAALRSAFAGFVSNYDEERVYDSDIKKIFQWYNLLAKADLLKSKEEKKEVEA